MPYWPRAFYLELSDSLSAFFGFSGNRPNSRGSVPLVAAPAFQSLGLNCLYHITADFQKIIRVNMSHVVVITFITWPEVFLKVLFSGEQYGFLTPLHAIISGP